MGRVYVILTRDLRVYDNNVINVAANDTKSNITLVFIISRTQFDLRGAYTSKRALAFLCECVWELQKEVPLSIMFAEDLKEHLKDDDVIYIGEDVSPFAKARLIEYRKLFGVPVRPVNDILLNDDIKTYKKFGPYFNVTHAVARPREVSVKFESIAHSNAAGTFMKSIYDQIKEIKIPVGGRAAGLSLLRGAHSKDSETHLSPYLRFGVIGARELYSVAHPEVRRQLFWRDFYFKLLRDEVQLMTDEHGPWSGSIEDFEKWRDGRCGMPIIDASMRELAQTGELNNRHRMLVAHYLVRDLGCNWKWGEKWFATQLTDYDWAMNAGNWLYFLQTGVPWAMMPSRRFNMWRQQKMYDPQAEYVKKWIPELGTAHFEQIHDQKWISANYKPGGSINNIEGSLDKDTIIENKNDGDIVEYKDKTMSFALQRYNIVTKSKICQLIDFYNKSRKSGQAQELHNAFERWLITIAEITNSNKEYYDIDDIFGCLGANEVHEAVSQANKKFNDEMDEKEVLVRGAALKLISDEFIPECKKFMSNANKPNELPYKMVLSSLGAEDFYTITINEKYTFKYPRQRIDLLLSINDSKDELVMLILRYEALMMGSAHWAISDAEYGDLVKNEGGNVECFASPFNSFMLSCPASSPKNNKPKKIYSLFAADASYGLRHNFFKSRPEDFSDDDILVVNPPFTEAILLEAAQHMFKVMKSVSFFYGPNWVDSTFYSFIEKMSGFRIEKRILQKGSYEIKSPRGEHIRMPVSSVLFKVYKK